MANPGPGFDKYPDYKVKITPQDSQIVVKAGDRVIASSHRAVLVEETKHNAVWYMPFADIDTNFVEASDTDTYCPFKGHASYWSILAPEGKLEDAIWAYLTPYDECEPLREHASFYTNKVDLYIDNKLMNKDGPGWTQR